MSPSTILTCAVTGNLTTPEQTAYLPITTEQIATACIEAHDAGAAAVHIHVRDPQTGKPSMDVELYAQVVNTLRRERPELIINLTTGPGGRYVPSAEDPKIFAPGTSLLPPEKRVEHIAALRPDICSLDLNTMNSGNQVVMNTPTNVRRMAKVIRDAGVVPELECFDTGDLVLAQQLTAEGDLQGPGVYSFVMGVRYSLPFTTPAMQLARSLIPQASEWTAFAVGRHAFQAVAQAYLLGGNVRIGLEDTIYIDKGQLAKSNAELVTKARRIVEDLGGTLATSAEARQRWGLAPNNQKR
ncbi:3-keto-5-aminohexanoate cleavage protein [Diaphorobacter sp. HDW4B]|uniref:3-keto-5-aminohexanoate cleavage protein n=1 Tax=Diaphorobacter sp. HDW4B TaxID=2714925 RepID=UPI00140B2622|nr:3-keto-5-aminohexanoate cleavage protein [Diaphorobacter sp. HDW4B]QIL73216.1 3-keto-5-aminohexanoate cleavage protein [Diaphorobacter sp. HDW4B]